MFHYKMRVNLQLDTFSGIIPAPTFSRYVILCVQTFHLAMLFCNELLNVISLQKLILIYCCSRLNALWGCDC